jgi:hypothetical protein
MESNKIAVLDKKLPLRAYPEKMLNDVLETSFKFWLANLLSIKADNEQKLDSALPAIKKHFWSLGLNEIKKAFEMYADGELITKPIPNYFDRILVGHIFKEYKQQKPIVKKEIKMPEPTEEQKELIVYEGLIFCYDNWYQTKDIINGQVWVHDHLMELGLLEFTDDQKKTMWIKSLENLKEYSKLIDYESAKELIAELERGKSSKREIEYKKVRLKRFFANIYTKDKHLKDYL